MSTTTTPAVSGAGFPFYYGLVVDKLIVGAQIVFWWLITIPLIIWAFVRTALLYTLLLAVLLVPIILTFTVGLFLFLVAVYWTPAISIALTNLAPLIAAAVEVGVFGLNIAWFILIALVDLWNILIPLFVVFFIYTVHFTLTVITLVVRQLRSTEITALFNELIEVGFFFADLIVIVCTTIVSVLPAALTLTISVAQPLLVLFFRVIVFLFPAFQFLLLTLFQLLPAVFFSVLKLVRVFRSLLRDAPVVGAVVGSMLGPDDEASNSPRYKAGTDAYFNALVKEAEGKDWEGALDAMDQIVRAQETMPDYSHLSNPFDPGSNRKRRRSDDSPLPVSRGSLHKRWRGNETDTLHEQHARMWDDEALYSRSERAHILGTAVLEGMHSVMDTAAPLHTHREMMTRALDKSAELFGGYKSVWHALDDYNLRYGHPALWLAHRVPDLHGSWLGRIVRESNPDDPFNAGQTHHEWRRSGYPPVKDHPNAEHVNRAISENQARVVAYGRKRGQQRLDFVPVQVPDTGLPEGDVPLPFEMPVVLGTDCFRSNPKFILCLPRPKPRTFKAPDILIPTSLPDAETCAGFVPPPDPSKGLDAVLWAMFNPITAIRNTWNYIRYILSAFANVVYAINEETVSNPWLAWLLELVGLVTDDPLELEDLICLIPYAWYPFYTAIVVIAFIGLLLPFLWLIFSLVVYILLPFRKTWALVSRLLLYYELTAERVEVLDTRDTADVARQKWWREKAVLREARGRAELEPGSNARDIVGQYERMRSRPFTEQRVADDFNAMDIEQLHRLHTINREVEDARRQRDLWASQVRSVVDNMHHMGALSPYVRHQSHARSHMSRFVQQWLGSTALPSHTATLAYSHDRLRNMEVALGHRPLDEAVPLTDWD